ncbi:gluconokinase [Deinococcus sp. QL22]|uniref:gluconokinase n=1 Tax=Deinococcus sp. QL22 TaxID=2939437 RepID=UPI002017A13E|nr:gluconokinase [Deinococcus sp. QL22]UQN09103.1 gluconokinase [Deinococcus sp. QL22]
MSRLASPSYRPVNAPPPVVLSLDIGSSGVKGAGFDVQGRALTGLEAYAPVELRYAAGGVAEVPLPELVAGVESVLDALHQRLGTRPVLAVALTSIASSLVALDRAGQPTGPVLSYADTRAAGEVASVARAVSTDEVGCPPFSAYWSAQLRWWRKAHPHLRVDKFCSVPDYLLLHWTGELTTSYSLASWTGMLDRTTWGWNAAALEVAGTEAGQLPTLTEHDCPLTLSALHRARWPKLAGVPFYPGVADGATANVGSGALTPSRVAVTVGSTSAVRMAVQGGAPPIPVGLWSYCIRRDVHLLGGALTEGGNLYSWLQQTVRLSGKSLDTELLSMAPDSHGLTFIPSLGGTRSPDYDPYARGTLHGLSYATTPVHMARAAMEAVACRLAELAHRLPLPDDAVFIGSGKALLASRPWQQMLADALGKPLLLEDRQIGASARGAALLALSAQGYPVATEPTAQRLVEPVPASHDTYRAATLRMRHLGLALQQVQPVEELTA